jgi:hypothetical protein
MYGFLLRISSAELSDAENVMGGEKIAGTRRQTWRSGV